MKPLDISKICDDNMLDDLVSRKDLYKIAREFNGYIPYSVIADIPSIEITIERKKYNETKSR